MRYLILIYENENEWQATDEEMGRWFGLSEDMQKAGVMVAGEALAPTTTATTVRVRGGRTLTTDGPFAETKEQLGGFYLVDCDSLDDALAWAAKMPTAERGSIEVRPIADYSQP